ncbi:phage portal protein [uncultured Clostridium sp.]|jgi:HK97 family phage portal protein|uniref:phage portal protein n=1 Tax=uncultured Clostridium sp. TaxID=59620 RepID=UPI00207021A6|nr:phage portal protein [uncultured Clostridium sp.]DAP98270.1 MAG TPA: portal protein [Caudoviricetes sp.]
MKLFNFRKKEKRSIEVEGLDQLTSVLQEHLKTDITKEMALDIPTIAAGVELIKNTISSLTIKLFKEENGKVKEVKDDIRLVLLNDETGDTLNAFQFKCALIEDFLLHGNGYAYINKERGKFKSLHYVKESQVHINNNCDPIFKNYEITVDGEFYKPYNFIKILKNSEDGATGKGLLDLSQKILSVAYNSLDYENILALTGGNKKGFITSDIKLDSSSINTLKAQWKKLYSKNSENCVVLNKGLEFKESGSTSTELQMNENKKTNAIELCKILNIPAEIFTGEGTKVDDDVFIKFVKICIIPILSIFIAALNQDLLLEKEKGSFYFAFDAKDLLKGDIEKRYKAYETAIKNKILTVNEVRYEEDKEPIEAFNDIVVLGLNDVLYNTKTGEVYTPNTDKTTNMNLKGGESNENRNS